MTFCFQENVPGRTYTDGSKSSGSSEIEVFNIAARYSADTILNIPTSGERENFSHPMPPRRLHVIFQDQLDFHLTETTRQELAPVLPGRY